MDILNVPKEIVQRRRQLWDDLFEKYESCTNVESFHLSSWCEIISIISSKNSIKQDFKKKRNHLKTRYLHKANKNKVSFEIFFLLNSAQQLSNRTNEDFEEENTQLNIKKIEQFKDDPSEVTSIVNSVKQIITQANEDSKDQHIQLRLKTPDKTKKYQFQVTSAEQIIKQTNVNFKEQNTHPTDYDKWKKLQEQIIKKINEGFEDQNTQLTLKEKFKTFPEETQSDHQTEQFKIENSTVHQQINGGSKRFLCFGNESDSDDNITFSNKNNKYKCKDQQIINRDCKEKYLQSVKNDTNLPISFEMKTNVKKILNDTVKDDKIKKTTALSKMSLYENITSKDIYVFLEETTKVHSKLFNLGVSEQNVDKKLPSIKNKIDLPINSEVKKKKSNTKEKHDENRIKNITVFCNESLNKTERSKNICEFLEKAAKAHLNQFNCEAKVDKKSESVKKKKTDLSFNSKFKKTKTNDNFHDRNKKVTVPSRESLSENKKDKEICLFLEETTKSHSKLDNFEASEFKNLNDRNGMIKYDSKSKLEHSNNYCFEKSEQLLVNKDKINENIKELNKQKLKASKCKKIMLIESDCESEENIVFKKFSNNFNKNSCNQENSHLTKNKEMTDYTDRTVVQNFNGQIKCSSNNQDYLDKELQTNIFPVLKKLKHNLLKNENCITESVDGRLESKKFPNPTNADSVLKKIIRSERFKNKNLQSELIDTEQIEKTNVRKKRKIFKSNKENIEIDYLNFSNNCTNKYSDVICMSTPYPKSIKSNYDLIDDEESSFLLPLLQNKDKFNKTKR